MSIFLSKKILITAGPTYEPIDPVRFIGNRSSGKMGIEIAKKLLDKGAEVHLVMGPSTVEITPHKNLHVTRIETASEMYNACMEKFSDMSVGIFAAAVADYTPVHVASEKIKKAGDSLILELKKTKDILKEIGSIKKTTQITVGFALETTNEIEHAKEKLQKKNVDFLVLNSLKDTGAGFQHDTNKITILDKHNNITTFELKTKTAVAVDIVNYLEQYL